MRKKIIILIISIIIPIIAAVSIAVYDYQIWYSQTGNNAITYRAKYQSYFLGKQLEVTAKPEDFIRQTEERISMFRKVNGYQYSVDPIFTQDVLVGDELLFKVAIYKDLAIYQPSGNVDPTDRIRYEIYIYSVNYDLLKELFMDANQLPSDKKDVEKAGNPSIIINFYPDEDYDDEEALFISYNNPGHENVLYNGKTIVGSKLTSGASIALYDYNSSPKYNDLDEPFVAQYLTFTDYAAKLNLNSTGDATEKNGTDRFDNGAYLRIETVLTVDTTSFVYKNTLFKGKVDEFNFDLDRLNDTEYVEGFENDITKMKFDNALSYNMFIFTRYVWWQMLIALVGMGLIMTGFYFTFTYEEENPKKNLKKKKKKK